MRRRWAGAHQGEKGKKRRKDALSGVFALVKRWYKYVKYGTGGGFWIDNADCGHREIIDRWAAEGWRYAGYIPACFSGRGGVATVDLIFEREIAEDTEH